MKKLEAAVKSMSEEQKKVRGHRDAGCHSNQQCSSRNRFRVKTPTCVFDRVIDGLWNKNASSIVHSTRLLVSGQRHHQEAAGGDPRAAGQNQSEEQRDGVAGEAAAGHLGPASAP